jgi:hypothetical protein
VLHGTPTAAAQKITWGLVGAVFDATNLRWAWAEACDKIGVGKFDKEHRQYQGLKLHDLRARYGSKSS